VSPNICILDSNQLLFRRNEPECPQVTPEKAPAVEKEPAITPAAGAGNGKPSNPYAKIASRGGAPGGFDCNEFLAKQRASAVTINLHILEKLPGFTNVKIVGLDMVNTKDGNTHWLHRPQYWKDLVDYWLLNSQEIASLKNMTPVDFRDPSGEDRVEERKIITGNKKSMTLHRRILLLDVTGTTEDDQLGTYILRAFNPAFESVGFQEAYKKTYLDRSVSNPQVVETQLTKAKTGNSNDGLYWSLFEGALADNCVLVKHKCLDEFLTSTGMACAVTMMCNKPFNPFSQNDILSKSIPSGLHEYVYSG
jgi:hypothetical protein